MLRSLLPSIALGLSLAIMVASPALASAKSGLKLEGTAHLITSEIDDQGNTIKKLVEPVTVVPGDRILFSTKYANEGEDPVTNFVITNPLPSSVQLTAEADPNLSVSVDGGETWGLLRNLEVAEAAGVVRPAAHSDVTHLRWVIAEIAPNTTGKVEYIASVR